jgi:hypothetical protein
MSDAFCSEQDAHSPGFVAPYNHLFINANTNEIIMQFLPRELKLGLGTSVLKDVRMGQLVKL